MTERDRADAGLELERLVGRVLAVGIAATTVCLILGVVFGLLGVMPQLAPLLLTVGFLILLETPVARVAVSVVDFAREGNWLFFALTLIVLLELIASVVAGRYGR